MKTDLAHLKQKLRVVHLKKDKTIPRHAEVEHSEVTVNHIIPDPNFTEEQIVLFKRRFENEYDFYRLRCVAMTLPSQQSSRGALLKVLPPVSNPVG